MLLKHTVYIEGENADGIEYESEHLADQLVPFIISGERGLESYDSWHTLGVF